MRNPIRRNPLRVIIAASMASTLANWQLGIVIPLLVLQQTHSPAAAFLTFALRGAAYAISPFLGLIIDRLDQRTVFAAAQYLQAACIALLAVSPGRWVSALLLLLSGAGAVANTITSQFVLVPKFIDEGGQEIAVSRLLTALELARVVGLLTGGAAISWQGPTLSLLAVVVLYVVAGLIGLALPKVVTPRSTGSLFAQLSVGFRWLARRDILWLVVTMAAVNLVIGQLEAVLVTEFQRKGISAFLSSCLLASGLAAGAAASALTPRLLPTWAAERRMLVGQLVVLCAMLLVAAPGIGVTVVGYVLLSFATGYNNVISITYRHNVVPLEIAGRVSSVIRMIITGAVPASGFLYAAASRLNGFLFWVPALGVLAMAVVAWAVHTVRTVTPEAVPASM